MDISVDRLRNLIVRRYDRPDHAGGLARRFEQIGDEMDLHLIRSAMSPIISETNDCAHGIYDPMAGETIAQGRYGLPVFLANMQFTVQAV